MKNVKQFQSRILVVGLGLSLILPKVTLADYEAEYKRDKATLPQLDAAVNLDLAAQKPGVEGGVQSFLESVRAASEATAKNKEAASKAADKREALAKESENLDLSWLGQGVVGKMRANFFKAKEGLNKTAAAQLEGAVPKGTDVASQIQKARHQECNKGVNLEQVSAFSKKAKQDPFRFAVDQALALLEDKSKADKKKAASEAEAALLKFEKTAVLASKEEDEREDIENKLKAMSYDQQVAFLEGEIDKKKDQNLKARTAFLKDLRELNKLSLEDGEFTAALKKIGNKVKGSAAEFIGANQNAWLAASEALYKNSKGQAVDTLGRNSKTDAKKKIGKLGQVVQAAFLPSDNAAQGQQIVDDLHNRAQRLTPQDFRGTVSAAFSGIDVDGILTKGTTSVANMGSAIRNLVAQVESAELAAASQFNTHFAMCDQAVDMVKEADKKIEFYSQIKTQNDQLAQQQFQNPGFRGASGQGVPVTAVGTTAQPRAGQGFNSGAVHQVQGR